MGIDVLNSRPPLGDLLRVKVRARTRPAALVEGARTVDAGARLRT